MSGSERLPSRSSVNLKVVATDRLQAVLLPVRSFPSNDSDLAPVREFLDSFRRSIAGEWKLSCELFLQHDHLHNGDGATRFADHAKDWRPRLGMGLWPDRDPPGLWTKEEFSALEPGQKMRKVSYKLFRIAKSPPIHEKARDVMFGLGTTLEIWLPSQDTGFFQRTRELMIPLIRERAFKNYPFYAPLLESKTLASERASQWLCGATVYLRESPEDSGILIVSERPVDALLKKLGAQFDTDPQPASEVTT